MGGIIGICHRSYGPQLPWMCLYRLKQPVGTELVMCEGSNIAEQRNRIVQHLRPEHDWLLFIDDDHLYPENALMRLLSHGLPIVGAVIPPRKPRPNGQSVFGVRETADGKRVPLSSEEIAAGRVIEVATIGTGFTLIRARIFREMPYPWFELGRVPPPGVGEDTWFCEKAKALGYHTFVDCGLRVAHLTVAMVEFDEKGVPQLRYTKADET